MTQFDQPREPVNETDPFGGDITRELLLAIGKRLPELNSLLQERTRIATEVYQIEDQILAILGEISRFELLTGTDEDASLLEKVIAKIISTKEDYAKLGEAKETLANLIRIREVLKLNQEVKS